MGRITTKIHFKGREFRQAIEDLYEKGLQRGVYCGFDNFDQHYTIRKGATTYIYGSPFSGKSEFWFEIMVNLTNLYGWRHAIYSPESGTKEEIAAEIISKKCRKPFYKQQNGALTPNELIRELDWFDEYFYIIDPDDFDMTIENFFEAVKNIEEDYDVKIDTTACDPFNELKHEFGSDGRQDLYIENKLGLIRRKAKAHKWHNAIITHCTDQAQVKGHDVAGNDIWYYPIPSPRQIAGGQAWFRKAMGLICTWRPPAGMINVMTNTPFLENEVHVIIQKYKPKGTGKKGLIKLYYDADTNRYYEQQGTSRRYAEREGQGNKQF